MNPVPVVHQSCPNTSPITRLLVVFCRFAAGPVKGGFLSGTAEIISLMLGKVRAVEGLDAADL